MGIVLAGDPPEKSVIRVRQIIDEEYGVQHARLRLGVSNRLRRRLNPVRNAEAEGRII